MPEKVALTLRQDPITSPVWDEPSRQWRGREVITITSTTGALMPAHLSAQKVYFGRGDYSYDSRIEISTQDCPAQSGPNETAYRAVEVWRRSAQGVEYKTDELFDYSQFGYIQIGNVFVHAQNSRDVATASERRTCNITLRAMAAVVLVASFVIAFLFPPSHKAG